MLYTVKVDANSLGEIHNNHKWGYEVWIVNEPEYCAKLLVLENTECSSKHYHKNKKETFILLSGVVQVVWDGFPSGEAPLWEVGDKVTILPNQTHSFKAEIFPSVILEVSTHHEDSDTYRV